MDPDKKNKHSPGKQFHACGLLRTAETHRPFRIDEPRHPGPSIFPAISPAPRVAISYIRAEAHETPVATGTGNAGPESSGNDEFQNGTPSREKSRNKNKKYNFLYAGRQSTLPADRFPPTISPEGCRGANPPIQPPYPVVGAISPIGDGSGDWRPGFMDALTMMLSP